MDNKENPGMGNNQQGVKNNGPNGRKNNTVIITVISVLVIMVVVLIFMLISKLQAPSGDSSSDKQTVTDEQYKQQERPERIETKKEERAETILEELTTTGSEASNYQDSIMQEARNKVLKMTREEKEGLVTFEKSASSPIGLRVYVEEILLIATIDAFNDTDPLWAACGESRGKHPGINVAGGILGNAWINGTKVNDLEKWRFKKEGTRWYLDLQEALQFNIVQSKSPIPRWENMNFAAIEIVEEVESGGSIWRPTWLYNNYTGGENRVAFDHPKFLIKG